LRFEKAFGETGGVNIVIVKAPSNQEDLVRLAAACACILQPFEGRILQITTRS